MAANPKRLRIVSARALGAHTRALAVECIEGGTFDGGGGKYIIVHTGVTDGDKAIKRAYSLVPTESAHAFEMIVKRLGVGSNALHGAAVGAELGFSGPWGRLVPEAGLAPRTLFVATDTGITSALGVVEQHVARAPRVRAEVLWLRAKDETFLDVEAVRARVQRARACFVTATIPPTNARDRAIAFARIGERVRELAPALVIATGDGRIVHPLVERLRPIDTRIECYFHNPEKKSAP